MSGDGEFEQQSKGLAMGLDNSLNICKNVTGTSCDV